MVGYYNEEFKDVDEYIVIDEILGEDLYFDVVIYDFFN